MGSPAVDTQYEDLLARVLGRGEVRGDRTGTGTRSLFATRLSYDLRGGVIPLVTTKKVHFASVVAELVWMLSGSTNSHDLEALGARIWKPWADAEGELGPVYGRQWVDWGGIGPIAQRTPRLPEGVPATYLGVANGTGKKSHPLKKTWEGMIARCYDTENISYPGYGRHGVCVCNEWLQFTNFAKDAVLLPGYEKKVASTVVRYVLDKDIRGSGLLYGPRTCTWVTDAENSLAKSSNRYTVESPDGELHTFSNPTQFCREQGIPDNNFSDLWTGRKNAQVRHGFRFVSKEKSPAHRGVNQITDVIHSLRNDPTSRRHVVSAWNVGDLNEMALMPCHMTYQFHVREGKHLDCQLYQRSADMFLGVPFNIASYSLLTHMMAAEVGLVAGRFTWLGGDTHVYDDHVDAVRTQLERSPRPFPTVALREGVPLLEVATGDVELVGYDPHPAIKAPVSV